MVQNMYLFGDKWINNMTAGVDVSNRQAWCWLFSMSICLPSGKQHIIYLPHLSITKWLKYGYIFIIPEINPARQMLNVTQR